MKRKSGKYSGRCKDCDMMQAGGSTPVEMRMQGKQNPFNWTSINTQCPQGYYFSVPDNQCRRIVSNTPAPQVVPTSNTSGYEWTNFPPLPKTAPTTASEASLWHNTPEDIDPQTGETFNERLPAGHPDNPKTGEYKGDYGSVQTTTTKVPHNWNTDVFLGLRGSQVAASYLAGKRRDSLMNEYDYKQQSALGQMNPMPISQFQYGPNDYTTPNRLYAQQGGMMNPYSYHSKYGGNLKTIIREYGNWTNDAGPMDMGDGPIDDNGKMKKGGITLDEMVVHDFLRKLMQFGKGPHPYRGLRKYAKGGRFMGINPAHKGYCTPMTKETCTPRRKALAITLKKYHGFHENGGYYDDSRDAWIEADGTIGPNGPYRRKKGGLTPNKAREILHDGTAHGKKLTDKQRRYFGAMSKGHTNYTGK